MSNYDAGEEVKSPPILLVIWLSLNWPLKWIGTCINSLREVSNSLNDQMLRVHCLTSSSSKIGFLLFHCSNCRRKNLHLYVFVNFPEKIAKVRGYLIQKVCIFHRIVSVPRTAVRRSAIKVSILIKRRSNFHIRKNRPIIATF